ncbi:MULTISPECIES: hypothetical protein [Gordonia]|uniref:Uncharacterized protein n=1 Tax=Gordonia amicalis TaxID=89053 RepID=A0AAE4R3V3_9ACTN|nr:MULTISPECIES: hypothetical protein [Gordonia]MCZ0914030.1 hypothetical protein [Gordonia amicalis]MCZ4581491.1 hypothetical protein [Gordonia amicalis]MCZ4654208.1 hypothetical protein [Gordonia amicalis]MDV6311976.1 hypothetical protein [Gordonia amicalis]UPW15447.1 hypothetical protein M0655_07820 [Gordonia amicalis]
MESLPERSAPPGTNPTRLLLEMPLRLGFTVTGVVLAAAESAVTIARITAGSVQHEISLAIGAEDELNAARTPLALLNQLSELLGPERPFGRILASGGPLERLLNPGGVIDRLTAPDGLLERLTAKGGLLDQMADDRGILMRLTAKDGPLDRLTRPGGVVDQFTENEGILERLTSEGGVVDKLTAPDGMLEKVTAPGGILDRFAAEAGLLDQLVGEGGAVERAIAPGGPLDRFTELTEVMGQLAPNLIAMQDTVHELAETVDLLNQTVAPLGGLAERLPKRLTRGPKGSGGNSDASPADTNGRPNA